MIEAGGQKETAKKDPAREKQIVHWISTRWARIDVQSRCPNPACPAKTGQRIGHFVSRGGFDIEGVGGALVEQLQSRGLVVRVSYRGGPPGRDGQR